MSKIATLMQQAAAGAVGEALAIEDVFSTYLYTGNSSTQTITNGIDLSGEDGLVWIKSRSNADPHLVFDADRGINKFLYTNATDAEQNKAGTLTSFNVDGFSLGSTNEGQNFSGLNYASWTFRKAPRFFDVVTWTGDGTTGRAISHNLGNNVGFIVAKKTSGTGDWNCLHRSITITGSPAYGGGRLNLTGAFNAYTQGWNDTFPTSTEFYVSHVSGASNSTLNTSGETYVAYLFAHDPLGPSGDGSDGLIACGSFNTGGSGTGSVTLGWEPQFCLKKASSTTGNWVMADVMRGASVNTTNNRQYLLANSSGAESASEGFYPTATGFVYQGLPTSTTYIYIAIRRGPMRQPTSGTEVFAIDTESGTSPSPPAYTSGFPVDMGIYKTTTGSSSLITSRLTQNAAMNANTTAAEFSSANMDFDFMDGWFNGSTVTSTRYSWMFRRAPGFFDVVAYTGNGVAGRTVSHNLGVAPELMIVKNRTSSGGWLTYAEPRGISKYLFLDQTSAETDVSVGYDFFFSTSPTATNFTVNSGFGVNGSGQNFIAYLFATLAGISKVGSYTGNGSSQTINCGFTGGARFVLIKRTDGGGDWYVWDTTRGIVSGNDPHLSLNTTVAEVTSDDTIDPDSSGFIVNQVLATNVNQSSASYIYLAIA